ncbi:hypothetical protein P280DRAFT_548987 [Massarina eburnea CBS 473.64]|uniref:Uncharacterized protein n=1 Tax=Massarina eburnea CBS 473.64 TaxID=1395130 RepID=A0A6A6S4B3_9PLEO|nr:hypothetical protein P280DRAFT_548987 [Massarina eburnea CBS 473.64]
MAPKRKSSVLGSGGRRELRTRTKIDYNETGRPAPKEKKAVKAAPKKVVQPKATKFAVKSAPRRVAKPVPKEKKAAPKATKPASKKIANPTPKVTKVSKKAAKSAPPKASPTSSFSSESRGGWKHVVPSRKPSSNSVKGNGSSGKNFGAQSVERRSSESRGGAKYAMPPRRQPRSDEVPLIRY